MPQTSVPRPIGSDASPAPDGPDRSPSGGISRLEIAVGATIAVVMAVLLVLEPDILGAPFQNGRTLIFTFGGTALALVALVAMLRFRVPAPIRVTVLVVPFVVVNWWLLSPYFVDDVVDEEFSTSISDQLSTTETTPTTDAPAADAPTTDAPTTDAPTEPAPAPPPPSGPVLLGAGQFVGLAGHTGNGDAGLFQDDDGSQVLRFEDFDIENGPDLEVYVVPGADQTSLPEGSIHLGALKGNVGDQTYELPSGAELAPGDYTVLVWCEAFSVEFVGATISV